MVKRYEALATSIEQSIRSGVLRSGDRLPSIRQTGLTRGVSASTVFQAYYLLEGRGLIRARERSGYFVSPAAGPGPPQPDHTSRPPDETVPVDVSELIFRILEGNPTHDSLGFGSAFPSPLLFPSGRLGELMASSGKTLDPWSSMDDLTPGNAGLRRQIARRYAADGINVAAEEIVITNGALEALNLCLAAVARPGDSVVLECPSFYGALQALERMGMQAVQVPTHPCEGLDLMALEHALVQHKPKACWVMTTFQNPLGSLMPEHRKKQLVELLARHGVPLLEDDVYAELFFGDRRPMPAKAFDTQGLVMHCSSFSKCLAPWYRIGWAAPGRYAKTVARQKLTFNLSTSVLAQRALAKYLERGSFDRHLRRLRQTLAGRQAALVRAVGACFPAGTKVTQPQGGYFLWVELPEQFDALEIHAQALALGICLTPGPIFSATRGFTNCIRLNYGHEWSARAEQAIAALGRLLRG